MLWSEHLHSSVRLALPGRVIMHCSEGRETHLHLRVRVATDGGVTRVMALFSAAAGVLRSIRACLRDRGMLRHSRTATLSSLGALVFVAALGVGDAPAYASTPLPDER